MLFPYARWIIYLLQSIHWMSMNVDGGTSVMDASMGIML